MAIGSSICQITIGVLLPLLLLGCKTDLDLTRHTQTKTHPYARITVGDYLAIRTIEQRDGSMSSTIYQGYLGRGDQIRLSPGRYRIGTILVYDEREITQPGYGYTQVVLRTKKVDYLEISVQPGEYEISNEFSTNPLRANQGDVINISPKFVRTSPPPSAGPTPNP
jgi:hypothetical protein